MCWSSIFPYTVYYSIKIKKGIKKTAQGGKRSFCEVEVRITFYR